MKFYSVQYSLDEKIIGNYPQVEEGKYNCHIYDEPKFINHVHFEKIDFEPIVANAILKSNSKPTDLINSPIVGFSTKLLVSGKLKKIIESARKSGLQFFSSPIIYRGEEINDYWILNAHEINLNFVDFEKSEVFEVDNEKMFKKIVQLEIKTVEGFNQAKEHIKEKGYPHGITIENIHIADNVTSNFFVLLNVEGGVKYVVSENLKRQIEDSNCTGIEFMPIEMNFSDWLEK